MSSHSILNQIYRSQLLKYFPSALHFRFTSKNELTLIVQSSKLFEVVQFLKFNQNCQFKCLTEICSVDYPFRKNRFEIIYCLLSLHFNRRIRVKTVVHETRAIESITSLFSSAN